MLGAYHRGNGSISLKVQVQHLNHGLLVLSNAIANLFDLVTIALGLVVCLVLTDFPHDWKALIPVMRAVGEFP